MANRLLNIFVVSVVILTIFSTLNHFFLNYDFFIHFSREDVFPMAASQNEMAIALVVASFLLISYSNGKIGYKKYIPILLSILLVFCEYFINQSRTGYLMELIIIVYYLLYFCYPFNINTQKYFWNKKRCVIALFGVFIAPVIIFNQSALFKIRIDTAIQEIELYYVGSDGLPADESSVGPRLSWYYASYKTITYSKNNFIFGCGTGDFKTCVQHVIDKSPANERSRMQAPNQNPHNQFIFFFLQSGIIGFTTFIVFILSILISSRKLVYRNTIYIIMLSFLIGCLFNSYMLDLRTGPIIFLPILFLISLGYYKNNISKQNTHQSHQN
jgi:O-antigen ligase